MSLVAVEDVGEQTSAEVASTSTPSSSPSSSLDFTVISQSLELDCMQQLSGTPAILDHSFQFHIRSSSTNGLPPPVPPKDVKRVRFVVHQEYINHNESNTTVLADYGSRADAPCSGTQQHEHGYAAITNFPDNASETSSSTEGVSDIPAVRTQGRTSAQRLRNARERNSGTCTLPSPPPPLLRPTTFWKNTPRSALGTSTYSPASHLIRKSTFVAAGMDFDYSSDLSALCVQTRAPVQTLVLPPEML